MAKKQTSFVIKDHSDVVLKRVATNAQAAIAAAADILVESVQEKILYGYSDLHGNPPHTEIVDTGRLFDSITANVSRVSQNAFNADVGTDVPYAYWVHEGTSRLKGRPFITDGAMAAKQDVEDALSGTMKTGLTGTGLTETK